MSSTGDAPSGQLLDVVGYALTSASALLDETPAYGPLRLLETARRILAVLAEKGGPSSELLDLKRRVDEAVSSFGEGEVALRARLDALVRATLRLSS